MKNRTKKARWLLSLKNGTMSRFILFLLPLLTACGADDTVPDTPQGAVSIGFSTNVEGRQTRSEALNTDNLLSMGIFAYYTGSSNWTAANTPNFMFNQPVTRTANNTPWTYSPVKYWPNNEADKLSFFAYAPYVKEASGSNPSFAGDATTPGYPALGYTVPTKEADQTDLLAAVPLLDQTYESNSGKVSFAMQHALTRVAIFMKSGDNVTNKKLTAFSLQAIQTGTMTFRTLTADNQKCIDWAYPTPAGMATVTPKIALPFTLPGKKDETKQVADFFLLPAAGVAGANHKFSITYTSTGTASSGQAPVQTVTLSDQPLPSIENWGIGAYVSYTFLVEKEKLTVTASTHPTWGDAGTGTVTGSVIITYSYNGTSPSWGNGGSGTVDGKPVVTHSEQGDVQWEDGGTDIVDK